LISDYHLRPLNTRRFAAEDETMQKSGPLLLLLLAGAALAADPIQQDKEPKEYAPKNKLYTIMMPAGDKYSESAKVFTIDDKSIPPNKGAKGPKGPKGPAQTKAPVEMAQTTLKDGTKFVAMSVGIPAKIIKEIPPDQRWNPYRDIVMESMKGKSPDEKDIELGGKKGKEYLFETSKTTVRMQLYLQGGFGIYAFVEGDSKERVNAKDADDFFASLKWVEKDKDKDK
jgi:hypothetical protein